MLATWHRIAKHIQTTFNTHVLAQDRVQTSLRHSKVLQINIVNSNAADTASTVVVTTVNMSSLHHIDGIIFLIYTNSLLTIAIISPIQALFLLLPSSSPTRALILLPPSSLPRFYD